MRYLCMAEKHERTTATKDGMVDSLRLWTLNRTCLTWSSTWEGTSMHFSHEERDWTGWTSDQRKDLHRERIAHFIYHFWFLSYDCCLSWLPLTVDIPSRPCCVDTIMEVLCWTVIVNSKLIKDCLTQGTLEVTCETEKDSLWCSMERSHMKLVKRESKMFRTIEDLDSNPSSYSCSLLKEIFLLKFEVAGKPDRFVHIVFTITRQKSNMTDQKQITF